MIGNSTALSDCKALVTGASGFIGSHLCRKLLALGVSVFAVSRSEAVIEHELLDYRQVDLADFESTEALITDVRPDYVFHLASHVMGALDLKHVLPAFHSNLQTTVNLLTALAENGCKRVVLTGSLVEPAEGELHTIPSSPYAAAKWASSHYAKMFHAVFGLPATTARVFMVYGPGQKDLTKLIPYVIRTIHNGGVPEISGGERLIDWIYVDDVVRGFLAMATAPDVDGKYVDLGSGNLIATRDIVLCIARIMGGDVRPKFGALKDRPMEPVCTANVERSLELTGWRPEVLLDDGLRQTIEFFTKSPSARNR